MSGADTSTEPQRALAEVERLQARVDELHAQLVATEAWAHRAVAEAQEKTYWLDRWGFDLNAVMRRPSAGRVRALLRALRSVHRLAVRLKRRLGV